MSSRPPTLVFSPRRHKGLSRVQVRALEFSAAARRPHVDSRPDWQRRRHRPSSAAVGLAAEQRRPSTCSRSGWVDRRRRRGDVESCCGDGDRQSGYWTTRGLPTRGLDDSRTGQLADAIGDFTCLVFLFGGICETASCPVTIFVVSVGLSVCLFVQSFCLHYVVGVVAMHEYLYQFFVDAIRIQTQKGAICNRRT